VATAGKVPGRLSFAKNQQTFLAFDAGFRERRRGGTVVPKCRYLLSALAPQEANDENPDYSYCHCGAFLGHFNCSGARHNGNKLFARRHAGAAGDGKCRVLHCNVRGRTA
jgi:hypothetical protein